MLYSTIDINYKETTIYYFQRKLDQIKTTSKDHEQYCYFSIPVVMFICSIVELVIIFEKVIKLIIIIRFVVTIFIFFRVSK